MDLKSLRQIKKKGVAILRNAVLCYAHTINWTGILTSKENDQQAVVRYNANSSTCGKYYYDNYSITYIMSCGAI